MPAQVTLTPLENALDSIRLMGKGARSRSVSGTKEVLTWGWHAVGVLASVRLRARKDMFDPWVQQYFEEGDPDVNIGRDVHWDVRTGLSCLEILDLMSDPDLPLLKPDFYQGWQDRNSRSRVLRGQVKYILGSSLKAEQREALLFLLAAYYRLVRLPTHVTIVTADVDEKMGYLCDLLDMFVPEDSGEWGLIRDAVAKTREHLMEAIRS